jgi:signal peptidase I
MHERLVALVVAAAFFAPQSRPTYRVPGGGMEPAVRIGQVIEVDEEAYRRPADVQRGDIVVFALRDEPTRLMVRRVVGLPGEVVAVKGGRVAVNGRPLPLAEGVTGSPIEQAGATRYRVFLQSPCRSRNAEFRLRDTEFLVLGDNRCASKDSRDLRPVDYSHIRGRAIVPERALPHNAGEQ